MNNRGVVTGPSPLPELPGCQQSEGVSVDPLDAPGTNLTVATGSALSVALIDCHRFSQECLMQAFKGLHPPLAMFAYATVEDLIRAGRSNLNLIIYYSHAADASEPKLTQNVGALRQAFDEIPIIVMSDAEDAAQLKTIRSTLKTGAHGFIPARTTGILITLAAIQFVKAGGTFAPPDLLLTNRSDSTPPFLEPAPRNRLTLGQMTVLSLVQQGKANRIIAHELSMSESTVKVHVRNIMRAMGATNRTQAAYKAQKPWVGVQL